MAEVMPASLLTECAVEALCTSPLPRLVLLDEMTGYGETVQCFDRCRHETSAADAADSVRPVPSTQANAAPLPQREDAERCDSVEAGRRCVLPVGHRTPHVYPPSDAALD
ncbi:MAG TPA: hypothetical protein VFV66_20785 [Nonomuraea sp.]|nr:hypothetical protein [Nonomuraea sp.]